MRMPRQEKIDFKFYALCRFCFSEQIEFSMEAEDLGYMVSNRLKGKCLNCKTETEFNFPLRNFSIIQKRGY